MKKSKNHKSGIQLLLDRYKTIFRVPENLEHYSKRDCRRAERKFLKYALEQRSLEIEEELFSR